MQCLQDNANWQDTACNCRSCNDSPAGLPVLPSCTAELQHNCTACLAPTFAACLSHHADCICSLKDIPVAYYRHARYSCHQLRQRIPVTGRAVLLVGCARMQHQARCTLSSSNLARLQTCNINDAKAVRSSLQHSLHRPHRRRLVCQTVQHGLPGPLTCTNITAASQLQVYARPTESHHPMLLPLTSTNVIRSGVSPILILTVTGTSGPAAATAAATSRLNSLGRRGRAEPPPRAVTLRTGQPKLRSMWCTPASCTRCLHTNTPTCPHVRGMLHTRMHTRR